MQKTLQKIIEAEVQELRPLEQELNVKTRQLGNLQLKSKPNLNKTIRLDKEIHLIVKRIRDAEEKYFKLQKALIDNVKE
ncbi:MAG: hypothetical protein ABH821_01025 [archaeon]